MDFVGQFSKEMAFLPEEKLGPFKLAPERPKLVENTLHILGFLPWAKNSSTVPSVTVKKNKMKVDYGRADPTSCEELLILEEATPDEIDEIIAKSLTAQKIWAKLSGFQRLGYLQSIIHEIISHINPLIRILAIEIGMPISEAKEEMEKALDVMAMISEENCPNFGGRSSVVFETRSFPEGHTMHGCTTETRHLPLGVMGKLTPWDSPFSSLVMGVFPALAVGNSVILKPHPDATIATFALVRIMSNAIQNKTDHSSSKPEGLEHIISAFALDDWHNIESVINDRRIAFWEATGSAQMGKMLSWNVGAEFKRLFLHCGSNNAFIINKDGLFKERKIVEKCAMGAIKGTGQRHTSVRVVYCHISRYEDFKKQIIEFYRDNIVIGDPLLETTNVGPVMHDDGLNRFEHSLQGYKNGGSKVLYGGNIIFENFVEPTIMESPRINYPLLEGEVYAPILHIVKFEEREKDDVIHAINSSGYGFACSVFTENPYLNWT